MASATFRNDNESGIVMGNDGSVFLIRGRGEEWDWVPTKGDGMEGNPGFNSVGVLPANQLKENDTTDKNSENEAYVAKTLDEVYYVLMEYPELDKWKSMLLADLRNRMKQDEILESSEIFGTINKRVAKNLGVSGNEGTGEKPSRLIFDDLTVKRTVSMIILFILVNILVRLSQYSMRLAGFWESRTDAVLLSASFAGGKMERFDNLVAALAPDSYDFKSAPKTQLDLFQSRNPSSNLNIRLQLD